MVSKDHQGNGQLKGANGIIGNGSAHGPQQSNGTKHRRRDFSKLLAAQHNASSGLDVELILLSWLLVLLKIGEDDQVSFEWAFADRLVDVEKAKIYRLSTSDVVKETQNDVQQVAAAIKIQLHSGQINGNAKSPTTSLVASSKSLTQQASEPQDHAAVQLELHVSNGSIEASGAWNTSKMPQQAIDHQIEALFEMLELCITNPTLPMDSFRKPTSLDLDTIWEWNGKLPTTHAFCMHDVVSENAKRLNEKVAITSWDGDLTYREIDSFSTSTAFALLDMGVQAHDVVPVCFEKSKWAAVGVLAVMKAGATFALMDPSLPLARLQNMASQTSAKIMVASPQQLELAKSVIGNDNVVVVERDTFDGSSKSTNTDRSLPVVPPSTLMYIIFTSGSTGTPKGVKISHESYTSSAIPRGEAVGYNEDSRVLDFASYAFDVSIDSMFLTLGNGGCLCIPSDEQRVNDINGAMREMKVTYAGLTPSVARILDPEVIASLDALGLGGEAVSARDVAVYGESTRIVIGYGPCECTIGCTINSSAATGYDYISIGPGNGAVMWIVDPNDHEILLPVGAVGELLVEGPIVGQGYLNEPEKTAAAFVEDPKWLLAGYNEHKGRRGRLYKTGDLGKYDPDGSGGIVFAGRKDTQVKLRGQRVELGEIESQLRARLPSDINVIVEVISSSKNSNQATLVVFVAQGSSKRHGQDPIEQIEMSDDMKQTLSEANKDLSTVLPRYMVPNIYIPLKSIPTLISGKIDRKQLRQFGTNVDLRHLDLETKNGVSRPLNDVESRLRLGWSKALNTDPDTIEAEDNFFMLGGDSLRAMSLVSAGRSQGFVLSVADIFRHPRLSAMAEIMQDCKPESKSETAPFSMITRSPNDACYEAAQLCGTVPEAIEDIYPCTPTQESLFTFSLKSSEAYIAQRVAEISPEWNLDQWKGAWEEVVAATPILRTHLAQLGDTRIQQVVLRQRIEWRSSSNLAKYLETDRKERIELGQGLARYAIIDDAETKKRYMIWTIHHVLYDGWSEPLVLNQIRNVLRGHQMDDITQMRDFVSYLRGIDDSAYQEYWQRELDGAVGPQFPHLPSRDYLPKPDGMVERHVAVTTGAASPFTMATFIRGAWALVASQYTRNDDVVFGETLTGRDISFPGVESIVGPLIATVPVRVHVQRGATVRSYLEDIQQGMLDRTQYQHMGMQNIRKVSRDAQHACEAPTGLVIQLDPESLDTGLGFRIGDVVREALHFNPYPLMVACGLQKEGFRVCASFDTGLVSVSQMERVLTQFEEACAQLTSDLDRNVSSINCLPTSELDQIWSWNSTPPLSLDLTLGSFRANESLSSGSAYPQAAIAWICDPLNPSKLSPIGCVGDVWLESNFLPGESKDSPDWLIAGSNKFPGRKGQLGQTGDMARLLDDGSVQFVRRKADLSLVQGHLMDLSELEAHFPGYLSSSSQAVAVTLPTPATDDTQDVQKSIVVLVECSETENDVHEFVQPKEVPDFSQDPSSRCSLPMSAIAALKRLDRFIQDSLPSYMAPLAYVPTQALLNASGDRDRAHLNTWISSFDVDTIHHLRKALEDAWASQLNGTELSLSEKALRGAWSNILSMPEAEIDVDDNFFRLGGDSVLAMKLVSNLRGQGHVLTVADIFKHMRLGDAAKVLVMDQNPASESPPYKPFSALDILDVKSFLSQVVASKLSDPKSIVQDAYPATDTQVYDISATIRQPRTSVQYTMLYTPKRIDRERLHSALKKLVSTHDILRTVFIDHEQSHYQIVLQDFEPMITTFEAEGDLEVAVEDICTKDADSDFTLGAPFLRLFIGEGRDGQSCVIMGLSHSQYDGISLPGLLQDLEHIYRRANRLDYQPFSSYIAQTQNERLRKNATQYWSNLLRGSSLTELDDITSQGSDKSMFRFEAVDIASAHEELTPATFLTAAWSLLLARRSGQMDVTFGNITSGRGIDLQDVENVMGPCYAFTPVRVTFERDWSALDLLRFVQKQTAESAAHDFLGFQTIRKHCTDWSSEVPFFGSIVHHQDVIEEVDYMPFDGHECKVDTFQPYGDAAYPFKAVSFVRSGKTHVGVVGSESNSAYVESSLNNLKGVIEELANGPAEKSLW